MLGILPSHLTIAFRLHWAQAFDLDLDGTWKKCLQQDTNRQRADAKKLVTLPNLQMPMSLMDLLTVSSHLW